MHCKTLNSGQLNTPYVVVTCSDGPLYWYKILVYFVEMHKGTEVDKPCYPNKFEGFEMTARREPKSRRRSNVLRKSVSFFIINIFNKEKIFPSCKASSEVNRTCQNPVWITQKPRRGDFTELWSKEFPRRAFPRNMLEASGRSFRQSVSIYPWSAPGNQSSCV